MSTTEVIVSIGAEGGSITLFGHRDRNLDWHFARGINDQTATFLTEEDGAGPAIQHTSDWVNSWPDAVALLDRYPWALLSGLEVHAEFRERVWTEVKLRLQAEEPSQSDRARERWARVCRIA